MNDFHVGISLDEAAAIAGVHRNTIVRWIQIGANGVKLRAWKLGVRWRTDVAALEDFRRACTPSSQAISEFRTTTQARKEKAAAEAPMAARGFKRRNPPTYPPSNANGEPT